MAPQHAVQTPVDRPPVLRLFHSAVLINLLSIILLSTSSFASPDQTISLSVTNAPLEKVFKEIQKQSGYTFVYTREVLAQAKPVTVRLSNVRVEEALAECLKEQPVTYSVVDRMVIIKPRKAMSAVQVSESVISESMTVSGRVTDDQGNPLVGANVKIKGTNIGTATDAQGGFSLANVDEGMILEFSFVGYESQTVAVRGKSIFSIVLGQKLSLLDETVVIAYGTTTRRLNTGNLGRVTAKEIETQPVSNPLLALQGRVPGLFIEQATGMPGSGVTVRIQGQNSLNKGSIPLYVIDGVPYVQQMLQGISGIQNQTSAEGTGNPFSYINPSDIESVEILKDADATSIYGSRAAAGAILITTKKGKAGKTKIDLNLQNGWSKVAHFVKLLNTSQYREMRREAKANDGAVIEATDYDINGVWDSTSYTDWQKTLIGGTAQYTNANLSISGGSGTTSFLVGGGYHRETTVFPGSLYDQKASVHLNVNHSSINKRFKIQIDAKYIMDNNRLISTDLTSFAINLPPNAPALYNADGNLNWALDASGASTWWNPLAFMVNTYKAKVYNLIGNALFSYQLSPGLDIKTNFGYTNLNRNEVTLTPLDFYAPEYRSLFTRTSLFGNDLISSWTIEPQLTYEKNMNMGKWEVLIGSTFLSQQARQQQFQASGASADQLMEDILSAGTITAWSTVATEYRYNALFGRFNFNRKNKYIINFTARRDGSSRFGSNNLFNNFWSVGGAWIFSNENFVQKHLPILSFGKFRASYGTTGNDQIGDYKFLNLYSSRNRVVPYQGVTGLVVGGFTNPYLQWEETRKLQAGLDVGFLNDRVLLSATYYHNRSSNQLQGYALPIITGGTVITINFPAKIQNTGWEFSLNSTNFKNRNIQWTSSFNLTIPKNKLVAYPNLAQSSLANVYIIGQPFTISRKFHSFGVDPATGLFIFADSYGNPTSSPVYPTDAVVLINNVPQFYGGFQNSINFKGFTIDFLFQFVKQIQSDYSLGNRPGYFSSSAFGSFGNQPVSVLDRWQKPGDIRPIQRFSSTYPSEVSTPYDNAFQSNAVNINDTYIRLKNLLFSWQLPIEWMRKSQIQNLRLYFQAQNILTFTSYTGFDPETKNVNQLPPLRTWVIGVQVGL